MSEIKLKPCPFCGSKNIKEGEKNGGLWKDIYIKCKECGCKIQICSEYGKNELLNRWNRRA